MEEKKNNEKDLEEKQEKQEDKEKEKKKNISDEDLEFMISEVENRLGIDRSQFKIIKHKQKQNFKNILLDIFISLFFNIVLIMSITGFFEKRVIYGSPWDVLVFALFFSILEIGIKYLLFYIFRKRLIRTMFLILTMPTLLAILLSLIVNEAIGLANIMFQDVYWTLLMFAIFIITRNLLKGFIIRKRRRKRR